MRVCESFLNKFLEKKNQRIWYKTIGSDTMLKLETDSRNAQEQNAENLFHLISEFNIHNVDYKNEIYIEISRE